MQPPEWRSFDSGDRAIRVRTLESGDFLVNVTSCAVTMALTVPATMVGHLFPTPAEAKNAA
jgi:hypothetical protein